MILLCAATGTEAAACRRGLADAAAGDVEVRVTGVGPRRAAAALGARLRGGAVPELVVSTGFAGALGPGLAPLAWVTASSLLRLEGDRAVPLALPPGLLRVATGATPCEVVQAGRVTGGAVRGVGAGAVVDMESAALAEAAAAAGVPFTVLRLVTDTPARPMAPLGRALADALAAAGLAARFASGSRAALTALRAPASSAAFLRETAVWRRALREAWAAQVRRGWPG